MKAEAKFTNPDLQAILFMMRDSAVNRVLRPAVNAALTPVLRMIKRVSPHETGTFKRAAGRKVKNYSRAVVGLAGIRTKMGRVVTPRKGWIRKPMFRNPSRYGHLVERTGVAPHLITMKRRGHTWTVKHPGMRPQHSIKAGTAGTLSSAKSIMISRVEAKLKTFGRSSL